MARMRQQWRLPIAWGAVVLVASALCASAVAQVSGVDAGSIIPSGAVVPGERLSAWLVRNAPPAGAENSLVHWRVATERGAQERLRLAVLDGLGGRGESALSQWLLQLPVTGRVTLARDDARWLQVAPESDPVLGADHSVVLVKRAGSVAVLNDLGQVCRVAHVPGAFASDYLAACSGGSVAVGSDGGVADWAWVVQPDGRVWRYGAQPWNAEDQMEPAPGAWLWAPRRAASISQATSGNLARFLATQMPAEAMLDGSAVPPENMAAKQPVLATAPPRKLELTANNWGEIGILQTPTARMEKAGEIRTHISAIWPYVRGNVMLQPVDWLEAGFRYTDIQTQLYGPAIAGNQTYKDKSFDLKVRLLEEEGNIPQIALGMRDIGGTGLFSSEYLVGSKRWGDWDASLGIGWGNMGGRGGINAPLGFLGDAYKTRGIADVGQGGTVSTNGMFRGDAALFGGVQWSSPVNGLILKAELDGNNYQREPFGYQYDAPSPLNFGVAYRYSPSIDLSAGWERGARVSVGVTLHTALDKLNTPKVLDPALPRLQPLSPVASVAVAPMAASILSPQGWSDVSTALAAYSGWQVTELDHQGSVLTVRAEADQSLFTSEQVERAVAILHAMMPPVVRRFVLQLRERGIALSSFEVDRAEWAMQHTQALAPSHKLPSVQVYPGHVQMGAVSEAPVYKRPRAQGFRLDFEPSYSHSLGGPDGFLLYEIGAQASFEKHFAPGTWLNGNVNLRLIDNYDRFVYTAPSNLPRVRTYAREFVTTSAVTLPLLDVTHVEDLGGGHYASVYGGMLESMYGGAGAEWLYRLWKSRLAFGVDVNRVRQRDFKQDFSFRDYQVDTGHATMYWDTGWADLQLKLSAGRYLAGDTGATVDVSRVFPNGTTIGAFVTKTNVSAEQFGEGSFDKGVYITVPFDAIVPKSVPGTALLQWKPLTRDGGAKLSRSTSLFTLTHQSSPRTWTQSSKPPKDSDRYVTGMDNSQIEQEPSPGFWRYASSSTRGVAKGVASVSGTAWAWGAATVWGASLLDNDVDNWARNHQGDRWDRAATIANGIPVALALGTGILFTGIAGDDAADTARTSLTAAAYTIGGNLLTKYAVGRSRPADELGSSSFNSFSSTATQSSFASNHVALAYALATPFARQYDNPWLYALAGTTALGRIQSREHWLSDTVAGGILGYAIGTITYEQQHGAKRSMRLSATTQSVNATWSY